MSSIHSFLSRLLARFAACSRAMLLGCCCALGVLALPGNAAASILLDLRLEPDGSTDPPGDRLVLTLGRSAEKEDLRLRVRAFRMLDKERSEPIKARGETHRDPWGHFRANVRATLSPMEETRLGIVVPYATLDLPVGTHRIGYEVAGFLGDRTLFVQATPLTRVVVTTQARREMTIARTFERSTTRRRELTVFLSGAAAGKEGPPERKTVPVLEKARVHSVSSRRVEVEIPGGFRREEIPADIPAVVPETPGAKIDAAYLRQHPWLPSREVLGPNDRTVLFATNRRRSESPVGDRVAEPFGKELSDGLAYGVCVVNIPLLTHRRGALPVANYWKERDPVRHFLIESLSLLKREEFADRAAAQDVFLYVHGFNQSFSEAVLRSAQIAHDVGFPGRPAVFTWPSQSSVNEYGADRTMAGRSIDALAQVLDDLSTAAARKGSRVHLLAHSLGNHLLLNAVARLSRRDPPGGKKEPRFGHVILAAPDVGALEFNNLLPFLQAASRRVTYYYCGQDMALQISQEVNRYEPVGRFAFLDPRLDTINADAANTTFLGHSYFSSSRLVLRDIELLVRYGLTPPQRMPPLVSRQDLLGRPHWSFSEITQVRR